MTAILIRTLVVYFFLVGGMKLMGKRQIGQMQISELVTAFLLSELAAAPILNAAVPLLFAALPIAVLLSLEIVISFLTIKCRPVGRLFDGSPSFLILRGQIRQEELTRLRISMDELVGMLRLKDVTDIGSVEYAILEASGQLSVFTREDCRGSGIAHPVLVDGLIRPDALRRIGRDEHWLRRRLRGRGVSERDLFLYTVDDAGNEHLIFKNKEGNA